ncbi:MAG: aminotransferase class I/II-fold pyridoxal phosphate-dependent enzyme, partial [Acidobacteria bacterium]|nr:aminotransferase class I/II-fold pyridoxal phosphate-dependent enzyme [Acidobacteriota bacterium]
MLTNHGGNILLVSDEPYRRLVFDGLDYAPIETAYPMSVLVGSHSKDLAIPGERVGYLALSPEIPEDDRRML